jgi:hypothetical protein
MGKGGRGERGYSFGFYRVSEGWSWYVVFKDGIVLFKSWVIRVIKEIWLDVLLKSIRLHLEGLIIMRCVDVNERIEIEWHTILWILKQINQSVCCHLLNLLNN